MATEQASEPQPSSSAPGQPQNEKAAPAEETPASRRAALLEEDMKRQAERLATPAPKPEDISALLPRCEGPYIFSAVLSVARHQCRISMLSLSSYQGL